MMDLTPPPLAAYIHFPWCAKKCPYCDFNSHELGGDLPETDYIKALERDLRLDLDDIQQTNISSVFMGGGTPSLFSPGAIADVLAILDKNIALTADAEITMEANPGTTERYRFKGYVAAGVNRLSIGVQSFNNDQLKALGRIHDADEAEAAFNVARTEGFTNVNIDLMHGLPGQSVELALKDLESAIALKPEHISWYQLTIEPNTQFYKFPPELPDEDTLWDIFEQGTELLTASGYIQYEISAYSQQGKQSRHNLNYWHFGDYIGIGAGAHGKLTRRDNIIRTIRTRSPRDYLSEPGRKYHVIKQDDLVVEFLMNALRLREGFSMAQFEAFTGLPGTTLNSFIDKACAKELVIIDESASETRIQPTIRGMRFLNDLLLMVDDSA
ncbi:MAG: radical SAM family heme chaperone HemW [Pseudomonadales bacterium]